MLETKFLLKNIVYIYADNVLPFSVFIRVWNLKIQPICYLTGKP